MKPLEFSYEQNKELFIFHPKEIPRVNIWAKYRKRAVMKALEFTYDQTKKLPIFHPRKIPRVNISAKYRKELSSYSRNTDF